MLTCNFLGRGICRRTLVASQIVRDEYVFFAEKAD